MWRCEGVLRCGGWRCGGVWRRGGGVEVCACGGVLGCHQTQ